MLRPALLATLPLWALIPLGCVTAPPVVPSSRVHLAASSPEEASIELLRSIHRDPWLRDVERQMHRTPKGVVLRFVRRHAGSLGMDVVTLTMIRSPEGVMLSSRSFHASDVGARSPRGHARTLQASIVLHVTQPDCPYYQQEVCRQWLGEAELAQTANFRVE